MHDDHDTDDLDFAMLTPPTRPGPCKATTSPEVDPAERRLEREREVAPHVKFQTRPNWLRRGF